MKLHLPFILILLLVSACGTDDPSDTEEAYEQAVSDFYVSLAASQTEEARFAFNKMNDVATTFPEEPAAWANLAVYAMRQGNFELADDRMERARELAGEHPDILFLSGLLESRKGNVDEAVEYMRSVNNVDPGNAQIQFTLINELERLDDQANADEIVELMQELMISNPNNQAVLFEAVRLGAKLQETELLRDAIGLLDEFSAGWTPEAQELFDVVKTEAAEDEFTELNFELTFLRNAVEPSPEFQADLRRIRLQPNEVGYLMQRFIKLQQPEFRANEPDLDLTFSPLNDREFPESVSLVKSATLIDELPPFAIFAHNGELVIDSTTKLPFPAVSADARYSINSVAEIDYNYNFRNDIALAANQGFRLYRQNADETFEDVTPSLNIPDRFLSADYNGVWPADVDLDGDLDLVLAPADGSPVVFRNNADGTFTAINIFDGVENVTDFMWADIDNDGAADALFLTDDGTIALFLNQRANEMEKTDLPVEAGSVRAMTISDINANGTFDLLLYSDDGTIKRVFYDRDMNQWNSDLMIDLNEQNNRMEGENAALFAADIDNNGSFDLILTTVSETSIWLSDSNLSFSKLPLELPGRVTSIFDIDGDNRLDLLGFDEDGSVFQLKSSGSQPYNARSIRARASGTEGDQRINSFGIGGEMEVRSGLLYQKQLISSPIVHFGLGTYEEAEMLRIIWPNGSVQAEFAELGMGSTIFNEQILKGSCPWLFTNDGEEIHFITDILWRSPLGLRINAQETAGVIQTLDRVRIPGDVLKPVDGIYDIRITAELWETHFFDHVSLVAVDHPENTEIFIDERFVFPAPDLSTRIMTSPKPVERVTDQNGTDLTERVREKDGNHIKPFERSSYQGLTEEYSIEIDLGDDPPVDELIYLIASGWLRPTDSSINLALSQGSHQPPSGLRIEIADGSGGWNVLHENYGVPAGKNKSILLELPKEFPDPSERVIKLTSTSEIYWNSFRWAAALPDEQITEKTLTPSKMDLRFRGYSEWYREDELSPKLPDYSQISSTNQRWRDLIGYHTRFGDVSVLLDQIDDRYVIMNAGDEMHLEFVSPGEPEPGYQRSFVFVSDGWVKDGDYNTEASKTVGPLPYHGQSDYEYGDSKSLLVDPVYQRHKQDWVKFHTRFVTPEPFRSALLFENDRN